MFNFIRKGLKQLGMGSKYWNIRQGRMDMQWIKEKNLA